MPPVPTKRTPVRPSPPAAAGARAAVVEAVKTLAGAAVMALFIMTFVARAFTVDGPSMLPTLRDGERLMVDKLTYRFRPPQRGDIVVFRYPADPREHFIKRIIGTPGDVVEIGGGLVYVNGQPLQETYLSAPTWGRFGPVRVPAGRYFVLGDNRVNSEDSRFPDVGFVPRRYLEGRAIWRFWPLTRMGLIRRPGAFLAFDGQKAPLPASSGVQAAPAWP